MPRTFIIGSRASKLAQVQTYSIQASLSAAHPDESFDVAFMLTGGDKNKVDPLYLFGAAGKALWTEELESALLKDRTIDFIVHSLKDMPTSLPEGAELGAIVERHDPLDSLVVKKGLDYKTLEDLPDGSVVGTSSVRRVAQLRRAFPKLVFADMRGNIDTRLAKLDAPEGNYTAIILAHAGLERMNLEHRVSSDIIPPHLYHAVGQGALGIEIRSDDKEARRLLSVLSHAPTEMRCRAERSCLRVLEGGCSVPVGVESIFMDDESASASPNGTVAELDPSSTSSAPSPTSSSAPSTKAERYPTLTLTGSVTSLDGNAQVVFTSTAPMTSYADADALGETVATQLVERGARAILDEVNKERAIRDAALKEQKKSKADKGLSLPASIAGSSASEQQSQQTNNPTYAQITSAIESATANATPTATATSAAVAAAVTAPAGAPIAYLPPGHPPIPGSPTAAIHAHPPAVTVPSNTIDDATPLLPASHPPILVTPSKDKHAETPTHCLRPPTPPPTVLDDMSAEEAKKAIEAGICLRPPTPEVVDHVLRSGTKRKADEQDDRREDENEMDVDGKTRREPSSSSSPASKRRAVSSSRREMQG